MGLLAETEWDGVRWEATVLRRLTDAKANCILAFLASAEHVSISFIILDNYKTSLINNSLIARK